MEKNLFKCVLCGNFVDDGDIINCVCLSCIEISFLDTISDIGAYMRQVLDDETDDDKK